jgi:hypothetical protein
MLSYKDSRCILYVQFKNSIKFMLQDSNLRLGGIYEIFQNVTESNRYSTSCHVIDHYTKHKFY